MTNKVIVAILIKLKYVILFGIVALLLYRCYKFLFRVISLKIFESQIAEADEFYLNHPVLQPDSPIEEKISFHIGEIKELAQKISEEKEALQTYQAFNDGCLEAVLNKYSLFRKQIQHALEEEELKNQNRYEKMELTLLGLQDEINLYRSHMENLIVSWITPKAQIEQSLKCYTRMSENTSQTEESYGSVIHDPEFEITREDLLELKDCLAHMTEEYGKEWVDQILKFYQSLKENYSDIKSLVYSCWKEVLNEISNNANCLDKVQRVEQTVFGILIFLQQQSVDAQTVRETLKFFDHKFEKFLKMSEARWKKSCSKLHQAFTLVKKSQKTVNESSSDFSDNSIVVAQQLTSLDSLVKEFSGVTKLIHDAECLSRAVEMNVTNLTNSIHVMTNKIEGNYARKLSELQQALLKPGEKLYILYKTTEDLHVFSNFLRFGPAQVASNALSSGLKTITEEDEHKQDLGSDLNARDEEQGNTNVSLSLENTEALKSQQRQNKVCTEYEVPLRSVLNQLESSVESQPEGHESMEKSLSFEQSLKDVSSDCLIQSSSNSSTSSEK